MTQHSEDNTVEIQPIHVDQYSKPYKYVHVHHDEPLHKLAKKVLVVNNAQGFASLYIDGTFFPFATISGYKVHTGARKDGKMPGVTFTVVAEEVQVIDATERPI